MKRLILIALLCCAGLGFGRQAQSPHPAEKPKAETAPKPVPIPLSADDQKLHITRPASAAWDDGAYEFRLPQSAVVGNIQLSGKAVIK